MEKKVFYGEMDYKTIDISNKTFSEVKQLAECYLLGYYLFDKKIERYGDKVYLILLF